MNLYDHNVYGDAEYDALINNCAMFCHEMNRVYCISMGDNTQPAWHDAPEWQKNSALNGVFFHFANPTADASASHQYWFDEKQADGWTYGPVKDPLAKKHPCMVPFAELPFEQQFKDHLFRTAVHAFVNTFARDYVEANK